MTKEIRLNAFDMNCVGHIQHGMWTHPRDRSTEYNTIGYWQDLARLAERGKFDGIFVADIVGVYDVYRGGPAASVPSTGFFGISPTEGMPGSRGGSTLPITGLRNFPEGASTCPHR